MRAAGLPEPFVETIETGWWTTCLEIVPPRERSRGRFHVYREAMPAGLRRRRRGLGRRRPSRPTTAGRSCPLFGTALFPPRLWVYSNFHCNLACAYCVVASLARARASASCSASSASARSSTRRCDEGFAELYVTGGEPFVAPRRSSTMLEYAVGAPADRRAHQRDALHRPPRARARSGSPAASGSSCRRSIDGARRGDARPLARRRLVGAGDGRASRYARALGLPLRVAMTETPDNRDEVEELRELLAGLGIDGRRLRRAPARAARVRGGEASGIEVSDSVMVPELTITADGAHWHPVGGDLDSAPGLPRRRAARSSLAEAKRLIVERFLALRQADGSLPEAFHCAV